MAEVPEFLASGEKARLIPVAADTSKENRATSVLLATVMSVDDFAKALLEGIGQRVGARANIECYTEVVFEKRPEDIKIRPDGLLILTIGKRSWRALFEAKIGKASLDENQIASYCHLAKLNGIDAVITLSNEFAALPTHHPIKPSKRITRGVELYHWSWMHVLTQASLLLQAHEFTSPEQRYVLEEMVRYFTHNSVGVSSFDRMNPEWRDLVLKVQSGAKLHKTSAEVENAVAAWHQEQRDLCLLMSRKLGRDVALKLSRAHSGDQLKRLKDDCETLVKSHCLSCILEVPDAAAHIEICADLNRRTISCSMCIAAPRDKKRSRARINWIVRQLAHTTSDHVFVNALWQGRAPDTQSNLVELRENPEILEAENSSLILQQFEIVMIQDLAGKFSGPKTFIEHMETVVPEFYEQVGQHLRAWVPPPPKLAKESIEGTDAEASQKDEVKPQGQRNDPRVAPLMEHWGRFSVQPLAARNSPHNDVGNRTSESRDEPTKDLTVRDTEETPKLSD